MNGNDFLNAMTDVDDKHIIAAEKKPVKRRGLFIGAMSAAAAAVIAVTAVSVTSRLGGNQISTSDPTYVNGQAETPSAANNNANLIVDSPNDVSIDREPRNDIVFPTAPTSPETNGELPKLTPRYDSLVGGMGGYAGSDEPETDS